MQSTTDLMVVETEDDRYLGTLDVKGKQVTIRTGLQGRPKVLDLADVLDVTPAAGHPDVVMA